MSTASVNLGIGAWEGSPVRASLAARIGAFAYGVASYALFFGTYCYAAGFIGNLGVPKAIDSSASGPWPAALLVNLGLLALFAIQHSVMARPVFKAWWTRLVAEPIERSTYVLASSVALIMLMALWQPMGGQVWHVEDRAAVALIWSVFGAGWLLVLVSTFLINHFDLFGLRQVWLFLRGRPYRHLPFKTPLFYRHVRHPLYVGWLLAFWATPTMTAAHLVFAIATTAYILLAIRLEERNLVELHGKAYADYRRRVPMLIPSLRPRIGAGRPEAAA